MTKRIFVLVLAVLMVALTAVSCGNTTPAVTDAPATNDPAVTTAPVTDAPVVDPNKLSLEEKFGKKSYDGAAILIITGGDTNWWVNYDVWGPEDSGEILAEALYQRNTEIEDTFDVVIMHEQQTHTNAFNAIQKDVRTGDNNYDAYFNNGTQLSKLVTNGIPTNLNDIDGFNFDDPWWSKTVNDTLNWGNENRLFAMGDMNVMAWKTTACVMYNYTLGKKEGVEDCFELVRQGKWTMDKWNQLMLDFSLDLDNNGKIDYKTDRYGLVTGNQTLAYSFNGMGLSFGSLDEDNWPAPLVLNERALSALEKVTTVYSKELCLNVHDSSYSGGTSLAGKSASLFSEGRFLFFAETIGGSFQLWNMEDDYGFLPFPKFDEAQEGYNSSIQSDQMSIVCIPYTSVERLDETVDVINAMGYLNMKDVKSVFFDAVFGTRSVRDENSMEMLEIILQDRTFDLGACLNFGKLLTNLRSVAIAGTNNFTSTYNSLIDTAKKDVENFIGAIEN